MCDINIYEFPDAKGVVVAGDIHGDYKTLVYKCCVQYGMTDTLIIVAGDCGFGFYRSGYYEDLYMQLNGRLSKANNWIVFVRGNHDNPAYFDGVQVNHERWKAVPDYSVLKVCGHTILCVGGAVSIDRGWRMEENQAYWPDEKPVYDQKKLVSISETCAVDTVISHTAPSFCEMTSYLGIQNLLEQDKDLLQDIKAERKVMDNICAFLKNYDHPVNQWYYGHFHQSWHSEIDGIWYNMLDCMELKLIEK